MNIQDAIRSGKPFKRKQWSGWAVAGVFDGIKWEVTKTRAVEVPLATHDYLAEDYELKGDSVTFECEWAREYAGGATYPIIDGELAKKFKDIHFTDWLGKRTRVTVEVIS